MHSLESVSINTNKGKRCKEKGSSDDLRSGLPPQSYPNDRGCDGGGGHGSWRPLPGRSKRRQAARRWRNSFGCADSVGGPICDVEGWRQCRCQECACARN
eukprot:1035924-Amorphochlora_amoeboformis.AAC.1